MLIGSRPIRPWAPWGSPWAQIGPCSSQPSQPYLPPRPAPPMMASAMAPVMRMRFGLPCGYSLCFSSFCRIRHAPPTLYPFSNRCGSIFSCMRRTICLTPLSGAGYNAKVEKRGCVVPFGNRCGRTGGEARGKTWAMCFWASILAHQAAKSALLIRKGM